MMGCEPNSPLCFLFTGMFGTGIQSYFSFLRFLVVLNLIIFLLMFSFVTLPIIVAPHVSGNISYNLNDGEETSSSLSFPFIFSSSFELSNIQAPTPVSIMRLCLFILGKI